MDFVWRYSKWSHRFGEIQIIFFSFSFPFLFLFIFRCFQTPKREEMAELQRNKWNFSVKIIEINYVY